MMRGVVALLLVSALAAACGGSTDVERTETGVCRPIPDYVAEFGPDDGGHPPDCNALDGYELYMLDRLDNSLADIDKVLAIEPRHFGALSGRVLIYLKQGKHAEALRDMIAALAIHPYLSERRFFPELAQDVTHV